MDDLSYLEVSRLEKFNKTAVALKGLQEALVCHNCIAQERLNSNPEASELYSLGVCEHRLCKSCVEVNKKNSCPVCFRHYTKTSVHVDRQLSNIAALCTSFSNILEGKPDEYGDRLLTDMINKRSSSDTNENQELTPARIKASAMKTNAESAKTTPASRRNSSKRTPVNLSNDFTSITPRATPKGRRKSSIGLSHTEDESACKDPVTPKLETGMLEKGTLTMKSESQTSVSHGKREFSVGSSKKRRGKQTVVQPEENTSAKKVKPTIKNLKQDFDTSKAKEDSSLKQMRNTKESEEVSSPMRKPNVDSPKQSSITARRSHTMLEKRNAKGETKLQVAAVKADFEKVQELLKQGANPNVKDNAGWTPLHEAVNHGNAKIAELLLDHGASVNTPGLENDTPLHDAVSNYSLDCVRLLIKRGANVTARNTHGQTALDMAKTEDMKEALLSVGTISADANDETIMVESDSDSIKLCFATSSLSKEENALATRCAKFLDATVVDKHCSEVTHFVTGVNGEGLCQRTDKYLTAVLAGAWILNVQWMKDCLDQGTRVSEDSYEVKGCTSNGQTSAPQQARMNRLKQLPGLFDGCQFYFHGKFQYPPLQREDLVRLAKLGGGALLTREPRLYNLDDYPYTIPYHAAPNSSLSDCAIFVIYDDVCPNPPHVKAQRMSCLPLSWFLDSITSFTLREKEEYLKE